MMGSSGPEMATSCSRYLLWQVKCFLATIKIIKTDMLTRNEKFMFTCVIWYIFHIFVSSFLFFAFCINNTNGLSFTLFGGRLHGIELVIWRQSSETEHLPSACATLDFISSTKGDVIRLISKFLFSRLNSVLSNICDEYIVNFAFFVSLGWYGKNKSD